VADSKKRFREQTERDENMVVESVSRVEYNHVVMELEAMRLKVIAAEMEVQEKKVNIDQLNNEIQLKAMDITNLDRKVTNLEQRLELATQAKDHFQKKLDDSVIAFEGKFTSLKEDLEKQHHDHNSTLEENSFYKRDLSILQEQVATLKRENDEFFKFLHKAEEDNKMLRSFTSDLQAKLGPAIAEKDEMEKKLNAKILDYSIMQTDCDNYKAQLWKVINSLKSFSKSQSRSVNTTISRIEDKLLEQQGRLQSLEGSTKAIGTKIGSHLNSVRKQRDALRRDQKKRDMFQQFADSKAVAAEGPDSSTGAISSVDEGMHEPVEEEENDILGNGESDALDVDYEAEYIRLKASDEKKSVMLLKKEEELKGCRKSMELQKCAMDSQQKLLESQTKTLHDRIDDLVAKYNAAVEEASSSGLQLQTLDTELTSHRQSLMKSQKLLQLKEEDNEQLQDSLSSARKELLQANEELEELRKRDLPLSSAKEVDAGCKDHQSCYDEQGEDNDQLMSVSSLAPTDLGPAHLLSLGQYQDQSGTHVPSLVTEAVFSEIDRFLVDHKSQVRRDLDLFNIPAHLIDGAVGKVEGAVVDQWNYLWPALRALSTHEWIGAIRKTLMATSDFATKDIVRMCNSSHDGHSSSHTPLILSLGQVDVNAGEETTLVDSPDPHASDHATEPISEPTTEEKYAMQQELFRDGGSLNKIDSEYDLLTYIYDFMWILCRGA
jgi:Na+-translocating ferredoxin:NAD+ oxidoreductase RNF subunit RnfB